MDRFWTYHERLPATLVELAEDPRRELNILDPATAQLYEYLPLEVPDYRLCAVFDRASRTPRRAPADFWAHGVGRHCFELEAKRRPVSAAPASKAAGRGDSAALSRPLQREAHARLHQH